MYSPVGEYFGRTGLVDWTESVGEYLRREKYKIQNHFNKIVHTETE